MQSLSSFLNTVQRGDCLKLLQQLPDACVDLVLTDPPYLARYTARDGRRIAGDDNADKFITAWRAAGFSLVGHLVWPKRYASSQRYVRYQHEQAYLLAKGTPYQPATLIPDVLEWKYTGNVLHPTQKPIGALLPLILAFSKQRDIVLDPFCGSGSTLVAAQLVARQYIGMEIDPQYYQLAHNRLKPRAA
jgi:adenine-specific DNA-methyltransferase